LYWFIGFFDNLGGQQIFAMILLWLAFLAAGWFSFRLWLNRMAKVGTLTSENDEFAATPGYAHFLQTTGERK
jgi:hypothetical protein